jgi:uncharacterized protein YqeY
VTLSERLDAVLTQAAANGDIAALAALRLAKSALVDAERLKGRLLSDRQVHAVIERVCAELEQAACAHASGGRIDLAEIERTDAVLLVSLLDARGRADVP